MRVIHQIHDLPDIIVTVRPVGQGRFEAFHAGRVLIAASRQPFCAAARALIAAGWPLGAILAMRHQGAPDFALRGRLGAAARLTIREVGGPRVVRWKPHPCSALAPPVRFPRQGLLDIGATPKRLRAGGVR
jgi:hypothetical protein